MKGYSSEIPDNCARARLEEVNASYKDLVEVCGRVRNKKADWALSFLEKAAKGEVPVLYRKHNTRLGHRRELHGRKGRYPKKAAKIVLKVLRSAIANGRTLGLGEAYTILAASANKKHVYPRIAPKGRWARSFLETSRVEVVLKGAEIPKGVTVTPPKKKEEKPKEEVKKPKEAPKEEKKPEKKEEKPKEEPKTKEAPKKEETREEKPKEAPKKEEKKPEVKKEEEKPKEAPKEEAPKEEKREEPKLLKREVKEHHEHKHDTEKAHEQEKKRKQMPHQHGEHDKR
jgi:ribosomal protein L22